MIPDRIIEGMWNCTECGSKQLVYPESTGKRVRVTCAGCGKFYGYHDHARCGDPRDGLEKRRIKEQSKGYD